MIEYRYTTSPLDVTDYILQVLDKQLSSGKRVLWLTSGGSNIPVSADISHRLKNKNVSNLYVSLVDERFGEVGHTNENWQQLINAGFELPNANLYRPLIGQSRTTTTRQFASWLNEQLNLADFSVGLFGIGADGHTAGIKPYSIATSSTELAIDYSWDDFERITMTPESIKRLNMAVTQAIGTDKSDTIKQLLHSDNSIDNQPAQVLKQIKQSILFTDYKEEKS